MKETQRVLEAERDQMLERFNDYGDELQRRQDEIIDRVKRELRVKVQEVLERAENAEKERDDLIQRIEDSKGMQDQQAQQIKEDMQTIKEEWNRRLQTTQIECERQLAELQAKHALNIATLQQDYQALMNERLVGIQSTQNDETERMKLECDAIKASFAKKLKDEFISIGDHEQVINQELHKAAQQYQDQLKQSLVKDHSKH